MKIAVPSSDGAAISPHFGRSSCFLIFDVEGGKIVGQQVRSNALTAHARGECEGEGHGHHAAHSHATLVEALADCGAVLCLGMGWRAAQALEEQGIPSYLLAEASTPEAAVALFLEGKLQPLGQGACGCRD
jgi:predicted Fe-Mo cluster-binding NifX family protein